MEVSLKESMGLIVGDVVQLKSGGPDMTITAIEKYEKGGRISVYVTWFFEKSTNNEMITKRDNFQPAVLKKINQED